MNTNKIGIVGLGAVGSTIAYTLILKALATEMVFIDANEEKALGEMYDLNHGVAFSRQVSLKVGSYADLADAHLIIITAGTNRKEGQDRSDLIKTNAGILKDIITNITKHTKEATLLLVSNPVDTLTYLAWKWSGFPKGRVLGTGTKLDTSRFRFFLSQRFSISPTSVHGYIIGNHGTHAIPVWSHGMVGGKALTSFSELTATEKNHIEEEVKKAGMSVIKRKQVTNYAIASSTADIVRSIVRDEHKLHTVSTVIDGYLGQHDVALSIPAIIGNTGVQQQIHLDLASDEHERFLEAVDAEKSTISLAEQG